MERYFFHVQNGFLSRDEAGMVLPSLDAAKTAAVKLSSTLIQECDRSIWDGEPWSLVVEDANGLALFMLYFSAIVSPAASFGH